MNDSVPPDQKKVEVTTTETKTTEVTKPAIVSDDTQDQSRFGSISVRALIVLILVFTICVIEGYNVIARGVPPSNEFIILVSGTTGWYIGQKNAKP